MEINPNKQKLFGLVLVGGQSSRMGFDKAGIDYHGVPQHDYLASLLKEVCDEVFLSINKNQKPADFNNAKTIVDNDSYRGPFNALMSAHVAYPKAAWLVLACDMPFMDLKNLQYLKDNRNKQKLVTAFCKKTSDLPEPLCAIWEKDSFQKAKDFFTDGSGASPSQFLQTIDVEKIYPEEEKVLMNINSPEEYRLAKRELALKNKK